MTSPPHPVGLARTDLCHRLGFAIGPLLWAPLSEVFGRRVSLLPPMVALALWSLGTGFSKNAASVFITRLFSGIFGSGPVSNVNAALGDIFSREARGTPVSLYAVAVVGGPTLGPVIGAGIVVGLDWRWTQYIGAIWVGAITIIGYFCLPEVYPPFLLKLKAERLRKETGDQRLWHPHERIKVDVRSIITKQLNRPILMLTTEPMCTLICFYASFVFGILYLTLEAFPIVFAEIRGWSTVNSSLPFLGSFTGIVMALAINIGNQPRYKRISRAAGGKAVPEARCPPMAIGGTLMVIGLFLLGWTADPKYHWILPVIATAFIGAGFNTTFQQCLNFLVDTYGMYAASATGANTFLRSFVACGLPLAARPMFHHMGVGPACSLLGAIAAIMLPVPFLFMKFGLQLRRMSKFAPVEEDDKPSKK
jgi:MFS family permease